MVNIADNQFNSSIYVSQITESEYITDWLLNGNSWIRAKLIIQVFLLLYYELGSQWKSSPLNVIVHPTVEKNCEEKCKQQVPLIYVINFLAPVRSNNYLSFALCMKCRADGAC